MLNSNKIISTSGSLIRDDGWVNVQGNGTDFISETITFNEDVLVYIFLRKYRDPAYVLYIGFNIQEDESDTTGVNTGNYWFPLEYPAADISGAVYPVANKIYMNASAAVATSTFKKGFELERGKILRVLINNATTSTKWHSYRLIVVKSTTDDLLNYISKI